MKFYREIMKGTIAFCSLFLSIGMVSNYVHIVINRTESVPYKIFLNFIQQTPQTGDYTLIFNHFYQGNIIKKIIGKEGDLVSYDTQKNLYVGNQKIGKIQKQTSFGKPLTPLENKKISKDCVFLYAPHEKSFDSRYKEVGLVHKKDLCGRLVPVI